MAKFGAICRVWIIFIFIGIYVAQGKAECIINIRSDIQETSPLVIKTGETVVPDGTSFLLPSRASAIVTFYNDEEVLILCAGNNNKLVISGATREFKEINIECSSGINFSFNGQSVPISDFQCTQVPKSTIRSVGTCSNGHKMLQIGYESSLSGFIRIIDICFDETKYSTSYVNYTLVDGIDRRQHIQERSNFDDVDYYTSLPDSAETYYTCSNQQRSIGVLTGESIASRYIKCSGNINYLTKTHLAPTSDFVYGAQQIATKYHVNVVPMWHSIKNGNWMKLEEEIRLYASNTSREASDLIIYSGTYGVTTFPNSRAEIYLGRDNENMPVVPVPKSVWKLVYEPSYKEGIVFMVVNNPYSRSFACGCVCAQTKWTLAWNRQDMSQGYVYCCTVNDFRRVVSGLPDFEVTGLLTKNRSFIPVFPDVEAQ